MAFFHNLITANERVIGEGMFILCWEFAEPYWRRYRYDKLLSSIRQEDSNIHKHFMTNIMGKFDSGKLWNWCRIISFDSNSIETNRFCLMLSIGSDKKGTLFWSLLYVYLNSTKLSIFCWSCWTETLYSWKVNYFIFYVLVSSSSCNTFI